MKDDDNMKYFSVKEVSDQLDLSVRKVYELIAVIEKETPHQFGRMFRGNYYRGKERKEKVISERDLLLVKNAQTKVLENENYNLSGLLVNYFKTTDTIS